MHENIYSLSGRLWAVPDATDYMEDFVAQGKLKEMGPFVEKRWQRYQFTSAKPILMEDRLRGAPPFTYPLICVWGNDMALVVSDNRKVAEHYFGTRLPKHWLVQRQITIRVHPLVEALAADTTRYRLTSINANLPAMGSDLKTLSLHGNSVSRSEIFRDHVDSMRCFQCGIRLLNAQTEFIKLGNDGYVSFSLPSNSARAGRLQQVLDAVAFLKDNNFLTLPE